MTLVLISTASTYEGTSGDTKPTDSSITPGSTFNELDTGLVWVWSGSLWTTKPSVADPKHKEDLDAWAGLLDELTRIRRLLEEANGLDSTDLIS